MPTLRRIPDQSLNIRRWVLCHLTEHPGLTIEQVMGAAERYERVEVVKALSDLIRTGWVLNEQGKLRASEAWGITI